jgi:hypothetical protein
VKSSTLNEFAGILDNLQGLENNGNGIVCVKTVISFMRKGNEELARNTWRVDGDKIRAYPNVECMFRAIFGCRLHFDKKCSRC